MHEFISFIFRRNTARALVLVLSAIPIFNMAGQTKEQNTAARAFFDALGSKQWDRLQALLRWDLSDRMDIGKWRSLGEKIEVNAGQHQRHAPVSKSMDRGFASIQYRMYYTRDSVDITVIVDTVNLVCAFTVDPIKKKYPFPMPAYVRKQAFREMDVSVGGSGGLKGSLCIPVKRKKMPAVIIVHGSGPQDRDGTILGMKPYRDLAWGLASKGIMVLRFEKRTLARPESIDPAKFTVSNEVLDDVHAAVDLICKRKDVDPSRIVLLGHDLGGKLAPLIAVSDSRIKGVVMLCAPARRLEEVLLGQIGEAASNLEPGSPRKLMLNDQERIGKTVLDGTAPGTAMFGNLPASYFYDLNRRNIPSAARRLAVPVLLGFVGHNPMASSDDSATWRGLFSSNKEIAVFSCPDCTHMLIPVCKEAGPDKLVSEGNVSGDIVNRIAVWCRTWR
jgi:pimeloyl-ACP methyl ester carboxylesterase